MYRTFAEPDHPLVLMYLLDTIIITGVSQDKKINKSTHTHIGIAT